MKNWMIKLEELKGAENAKTIIAVVACIVLTATIIAGNWYLIF